MIVNSTAKSKKKRPKAPSCIGRKLLAGQAVDEGLDPVKTWYDCKLGLHWHCPNCGLHPKKKSGG